mmetsp:Transcript_10643/g.15955  ORF Transcript_10643/g.15955 Transcript_10643/m.15955 type:complete len:217 (+) Transcript_10643:1843-2493(+)
MIVIQHHRTSSVSGILLNGHLHVIFPATTHIITHTLRNIDTRCVCGHTDATTPIVRLVQMSVNVRLIDGIVVLILVTRTAHILFAAAMEKKEYQTGNAHRNHHREDNIQYIPLADFTRVGLVIIIRGGGTGGCIVAVAGQTRHVIGVKHALRLVHSQCAAHCIADVIIGHATVRLQGDAGSHIHAGVACHCTATATILLILDSHTRVLNSHQLCRL